MHNCGRDVEGLGLQRRLPSLCGVGCDRWIDSLYSSTWSLVGAIGDRSKEYGQHKEKYQQNESDHKGPQFNRQIFYRCPSLS